MINDVCMTILYYLYSPQKQVEKHHVQRIPRDHRSTTATTATEPLRVVLGRNVGLVVVQLCQDQVTFLPTARSGSRDVVRKKQTSPENSGHIGHIHIFSIYERQPGFFAGFRHPKWRILLMGHPIEAWHRLMRPDRLPGVHRLTPHRQHQAASARNRWETQQLCSRPFWVSKKHDLEHVPCISRIS